MKELSLENIVQNNSSNITIEEIDGELAMMDNLNGNYILLNKMSGVIWKEIESPILVSVLMKNLMKRFSVDLDVCVKETLDCLNKLNQQNLLIVV